MTANGGPPQKIFIIRHGEKPPDPPLPGPPFGIDIDGNPDDHSLIPRGWQRSGALTGLFDPAVGPLRDGLAIPNHLVSPAATDAAKTAARRTYQTILGVSDRAKIKIDTPCAVGAEIDLETTLRNYTGTVLICWEHKHIPAIAATIPTIATIPESWPNDRFDLIWVFTLAADGEHYDFRQIPQLLLAGDTP